MNAVETALDRFPDKSVETVRLKAISREEFRIGDPMTVPFQSGATEQCYALKLVFCDETDELSVSLQNYPCPGEKQIEVWADELWRLWDENDE